MAITVNLKYTGKDGNATTAYNLLACDFLFEDFHIYAVDTIGHPGKSAERSLSAANYGCG